MENKELEVLDRIKLLANTHYANSCHKTITKSDTMLLEAQIYDNVDLLKQVLSDKDNLGKKVAKDCIEYINQLNAIEEVDSKLSTMEWTSRQARALRYEKEIKQILKGDIDE